MTFSIIWIIILILSLIVGISDIIKKKKNSKYLITFFICLTLSFIISLPIRKYQLNRKKEKAEIVIKMLDKKSKEGGKFPNSLKELDLDFETDYINYSTDSLKLNFYIFYDIDGWHTEKYNSNERKWIGGD